MGHLHLYHPDVALFDKDIVAPLNILKSRVAHVGAVCDRMEAAERQVAACVVTMQSVERSQKEVTAQCKAIDAQLRSKAGMTDLHLKVDAAALDTTLGELSHEISTELQVRNEICMWQMSCEWAYRGHVVRFKHLPSPTVHRICSRLTKVTST